MSTRKLYSIPIIVLGLVAMLVIPEAAEAQRRGPVRGRPRVIVSSGFGFGYPGFWLYDQWGPWGPWGPYGPGPYGRYRAYPYFNEFTASIKFDVEPKNAEVYVDGALAGEVDDFDGIFQSLKVIPGDHEIVVYREGFRSVREHVYVEPYNTRKLRFELERLAAGERSEPRPQPRPEAMTPDRPSNDPRDRPREMPRQEPPRPRQPDPRMPPPERREPEQRQPQPAQFGTLSVRVVPADAEVFVDGERWTGPAGADRLSIQLAPGRHRIEVRKQGMNTYTEEVLIRQGATLTLNVSLK